MRRVAFITLRTRFCAAFCSAVSGALPEDRDFAPDFINCLRIMFRNFAILLLVVFFVWNETSGKWGKNMEAAADR